MLVITVSSRYESLIPDQFLVLWNPQKQTFWILKLERRKEGGEERKRKREKERDRNRERK